MLFANERCPADHALKILLQYSRKTPEWLYYHCKIGCSSSRELAMIVIQKVGVDAIIVPICLDIL